jgi:hypothetical protein
MDGEKGNFPSIPLKNLKLMIPHRPVKKRKNGIKLRGSQKPERIKRNISAVPVGLVFFTNFHTK